MKIKNLKINQKTVSKLATYVLIGSLATATLTGCSNTDMTTNNLLKDTILENTSVITFENGSKDIAITISGCPYSKDYKHYSSIISGICFGDKECTTNKSNGHYLNNNQKIVNVESISNYLTIDDLTKAIQGELDNDDIIAIVNRVIEPVTEVDNKTR